MPQIFEEFIIRTDWGVVISIIALIFTAVTLYFQRQHNRLSVRPIAIVTVGDYEHRLSVFLQNEGLGPLIIKELRFRDESGNIESALLDFFGEKFDDVEWSTFTSDIDGWAIRPGKYRTLIELEGDPLDEDFILIRDEVRKVLAPITVHLKYQDIYKKNMPNKIRKLDFFARAK